MSMKEDQKKLGEALIALGKLLAQGSQFDRAEQKKKPDVVEVIRFVRGGKNGNIDNMNGGTIAFRLDYDKDTLDFAFSVCSDENFDKKTGAALARDRLNADEDKSRYRYSLKNMRKVVESARSLLHVAQLSLETLYATTGLSQTEMKMLFMLMHRR